METLDAYPTSYILDADNQRLILTWSDGHESLHPYELLRRNCPCALCAGEGNIPGQMTPHTHLSSVETDLYDLKPVGRYGLSPVWGDGHHTGIYTYEKLRAECQCDDCRASTQNQRQKYPYQEQSH
ncbi:MAG TPA: DUF971 domain-containing protein [Ktedonobacterales bacterium]|jgi:DUF971 family protein